MNEADHSSAAGGPKPPVWRGVAVGVLTVAAIIGGGNIYAQSIDSADVLYVTHVAAEVEGDTRFPAIDPALWHKVSEEIVPAGERDTYASRFAVYQRRGA